MAARSSLPLRALALVVLLLAAGAVVPGAGAAACGETALVIVNPDLAPRADGFIPVSGNVLLQVRPEGPGADAVASVALSLGAHAPDASRRCDAAPWFTGLYPLSEAGDETPRDGFFLPVNTSAIPDGEYGLALHAYGGDDAELARHLVQVRVENGRTNPLAPSLVDRVQPWPRVLPGDGEQTHPDGGLTIEFAERVVDVRAFVNEVPLALTGWTPPTAGAGVLPDALGGDVNVTGYRAARAPLPGDLLRVVATDAAGNRAEKTLRIGGGATTGAPTGPADLPLSITLPDGVEHALAPGESTRLAVRLANPGATSVDALLDAQGPSPINVTLEPPRVGIPANGTTETEAVVRVRPDAGAGFYTIILTAVWSEGGVERSASGELVVHVRTERTDADAPPSAGGSDGDGTGATDGEARDPVDDPLDTAGADDAGGRGIPGPAALAALAAAAAGAVATRRRRA